MNQEQKDGFAARVEPHHQIRVLDELLQQFSTFYLISRDEGFAFALLPAVAVSCRCCLLKLAVMTLVAHLGTFGAAAQ